MTKKIIGSVLLLGLFSFMLVIGIINYVPEEPFVSDSVFMGASTITADVHAPVLVTETDVVAVAEAEPEELEEVVIEEELPMAKAYNVPYQLNECHTQNFTYMSYTTITNTDTAQYALNYNSNAYTDEETGIRMIPCSYEEEDFYMVAIGQGYGFYTGDYIRIFFADGTSVKAIVGDSKAKVDCDETLRFQATDGSVVEFIVDGTLKKKPASFEGHGSVISIEREVLG